MLGDSQLPQGNPAADPRLMRRVIAEDPKWNLETIMPLKDVIIKFIVDNFHSECGKLVCEQAETKLVVCLSTSGE